MINLFQNTGFDCNPRDLSSASCGRLGYLNAYVIKKGNDFQMTWPKWDSRPWFLLTLHPNRRRPGGLQEEHSEL